MARSAANLVLRYGAMEIKCKLMKTHEGQTATRIEVHGKCGFMKSVKTICKKCESKTELRDDKSEGEAEAGLGEKGEQPAVLGTEAERPLKSVYCTGKCGALLEDAVEAVSYCEDCDQILSKRDIGLRFMVDGRQVKLLKKDLAVISEMRIEKEIRVLEVVRNPKLPKTIGLGETYQLVPDKNAECAFLTLLTAMQRERNLGLFVELKMSKEYCGLITLHGDKNALLLTLLYPKREVTLADVDFGDYKAKPDNVQLMRKVLKNGIRGSGHCDQYDHLDTAANHAFWSLIRAQIAGGSFTIPRPQRAKEQSIALTKQLVASIQAQEEELKAKKKAAKKKSKKKTKKKAAAR